MAHPKLRILKKTLFAFSSLTMSLYFLYNVHEFYKLYKIGGYFITFNKSLTKLNILNDNIVSKHRFYKGRVEDLAYNYSTNDCCRDNNNYGWLLNNVYDAFIIKAYHKNNDNAIHYITFKDNQDDDFIKGLLEPNVYSRRNSDVLSDSDDKLFSPVLEGNSNSVLSQKYYSVYDLNNKHYKAIDNLSTHFFGGWRGRTLIVLSAVASVINAAYGIASIFSAKFNPGFRNVFDPKLRYTLFASSLVLAIICFKIKNPKVRTKLLGAKDYSQYDQLTCDEFKYIANNPDSDFANRYKQPSCYKDHFKKAVNKFLNENLIKDNQENMTQTNTFRKWVQLLNEPHESVQNVNL